MLSTCPAQDARPWIRHPIFDPIRPPLERLLGAGAWPDARALNAMMCALGIEPVSAAGRPIRFVTAAPDRRNYELRVFETGEVRTREQNWHDLFNALAWIAFPRTKAALNALHAEAIPGESGRRGRLRDLLTLFDEGGALVAANHPAIEENIRKCDWRRLFWSSRETARQSMRLVVMGHAVLDMARAPWPGITCKVLFLRVREAQMPGDRALAGMADAHAAAWLMNRARTATPKALPALPIFGYPDWLPENQDAAFYDDARYFRPLRPIHSEPAPGRNPQPR